MPNTIVYMDGFENFAATKALAYYVQTNTDYLATLPTGHGGGAGIKVCQAGAGSPLSGICPLPVLNSTWFTAAFMFQRSTSSAVSNVLMVGFGINPTSQSSSDCRMGLRVMLDGSLEVRYDGSGVYAYSAPGLISPGVWYHIEYRHRYGNASNGHYEVRVNGSSVLSGVGDNSGVVSPKFFTLGGGNSAGDLYLGYDDMIVAQSTDANPAWLGISKVRHLPPTSTSTGQWTGSDGDSVDNHLLVDDSNPASTDWVTSVAGSAQRDLYGHAAATSGATVHGAAVRAAAGVDVLGVDDFSIVLKSGSTETLRRRSLGEGTPVWMESDVASTDPSTGTAWTKAGFDASLFGVKS